MPATEPATSGGAAKLLVDPPGDQDPVGGSRLSSCALLPGRQLGAITLADALHERLPGGKLLGRGCRRLAWHRYRLPYATTLRPSILVKSGLRTSAQVQRTRRLSRHEKAFWIYRYVAQSMN